MINDSYITDNLRRVDSKVSFSRHEINWLKNKQLTFGLDWILIRSVVFTFI